MLVLTSFLAGGNGDHAPNAFLYVCARVPGCCSAEAPVVADEPHGFVCAIGALAPMQQLARLCERIGDGFTDLANARGPSGADIVNLALLDGGRLGSSDECLHHVVFVKEIANLLTGREVHGFILPQLANEVRDDAVRRFMWAENSEQAQGDKWNVELGCQRATEKDGSGLGGAVE